MKIASIEAGALTANRLCTAPGGSGAGANANSSALVNPNAPIKLAKTSTFRRRPPFAGTVGEALDEAGVRADTVRVELLERVVRATAIARHPCRSSKRTNVR